MSRHSSTEHMLAMLRPNPNLPEHLYVIAGKCHELAFGMVHGRLADGPELTTGLRKLLEAKDCFVRQAICDDSTRGEGAPCKQ